MLNDKPSSTAAQSREHAEPSETNKPIPMLVASITLAVVLFGAGYILLSESFGESSLGDRRTLADLRGAPAAAAGAVVDGKAVFAAQCASCHQATGKGLPGVFPPLDGSEWVMGESRILANILLHGVSGEITVAGTTYKGAMPAFQQLGNEELAAVANYIRSGWSNNAEPLDAALFEHERKASDRSTPFDGGAELEALAEAGNTKP